MSKEEKLNLKIKQMEYEGKLVPQKYIDLFNSYLDEREYELNQQLAELKEENFELVNKVEVLESEKENLDRTLEEAGDEIEDLNQQLKEKNEEIEKVTVRDNKLSNRNSYLVRKIREQENYNIELSTKWYKAQQQLKTNTHEICEKIRNKFPKGDIPDETTYYLHEFLDQLEGGVK